MFKRLSPILVLVLLLAALSAAPLPGVHSNQGFSSLNLAANSPCAGPIHSVQDLLNSVDSAHWQTWIKQLSGVEEVIIGGQPYRIQTRFSGYLFQAPPPPAPPGTDRSRAYDFILEQIQGWYPLSQIEEDPYQPYGSSGPTWKNLVLNIPGVEHADQIVILSAHLDSTSARDIKDDYNLFAPGADDNATGAATLLEAARVLAAHPQARTIRLIWFTGEEQGLIGSNAYVADHSLAGVVGDVNVDMFGYDGDNDHCFELHVGDLPASDLVGQCFLGALHAYSIGLKHDYLSSDFTRASDHASFWSKNIGAVEVLENYQSDYDPSGCGPSDFNPYYHTSSDTFDHLSLPFSFDVARAALAATFSLANLRTYYFPLVRN
jgi:hypothetical protein